MGSSIAERVAIIRGLSGLSQRALAELAGLNASHVRLIEDGDRADPRTSTVVALAQVAGCTADWLATGEGREPSEESVRAAVERARGGHDAEPAEGSPYAKSPPATDDGASPYAKKSTEAA